MTRQEEFIARTEARRAKARAASKKEKENGSTKKK